MPQPPEWYRGMMPSYLNPNPNQPDIHVLNQQLNMLPDLTSDRKAQYLASRRLNYHIGVPRQLNFDSDKEERNVEFFREMFQSEIGDYPSKRPRAETPVQLSLSPWNDSSRLPSLQLCPDPALTVEQKVSTPVKGFEEVSSCARRCFSTPGTLVHSSPETFSGCSDVTKVDVMDSSPLDSKRVQDLGTSKTVKPARPNVTRVYSFADFFTIERETQTEERPLKHEKLGPGADVVEPMECDEQTKCEANADSLPLENRNRRGVSLVERFTEEEIKLHIKSLKEGSIQVTIVWPYP